MTIRPGWPQVQRTPWHHVKTLLVFPSDMPFDCRLSSVDPTQNGFLLILLRIIINSHSKLGSRGTTRLWWVTKNCCWEQAPAGCLSHVSRSDFALTCRLCLKPTAEEAFEFDPELVLKESRYVDFLRIDDFVPLQAAKRLASYWKNRKIVFGERWQVND